MLDNFALSSQNLPRSAIIITNSLIYLELKYFVFLQVKYLIFYRDEAPDFIRFLQGTLEHDDEDYDCGYPQPPCPYQGKKLLNHVHYCQNITVVLHNKAKEYHVDTSGEYVLGPSFINGHKYWSKVETEEKKMRLMFYFITFLIKQSHNHKKVLVHVPPISFFEMGLEK